MAFYVRKYGLFTETNCRAKRKTPVIVTNAFDFSLCIYTFNIKVFHLPVQKIIVIVITNRRFCTRDKPKSAQK